MQPGDVILQYSSFGKPALCAPAGTNALLRAGTNALLRPAGEGIEFNLSHAHGLALYAVTRNRRVGIDVEWVRPDLATDAIAEQFFSPYEVATLRSLHDGLRTEAFFHCWTRKEAYIKARGEGLIFPLCQFDVSLTPEEPAVLLKTRGDPSEAAHWSMQALSPGPGYVAAVAVERDQSDAASLQLKYWQFCNKTAFVSF